MSLNCRWRSLSSVHRCAHSFRVNSCLSSSTFTRGSSSRVSSRCLLLDLLFPLPALSLEYCTMKIDPISLFRCMYLFIASTARWCLSWLWMVSSRLILLPSEREGPLSAGGVTSALALLLVSGLLGVADDVSFASPPDKAASSARSISPPGNCGTCRNDMSGPKSDRGRLLSCSPSSSRRALLSQSVMIPSCLATFRSFAYHESSCAGVGQC
mmetsp:Transcript_16180/g.54186  ORF Transcript_16180/g.54186 Transcript_16180/m.54186 type:complete len:212 (-) Transcript_16180:311-946(-)